MRPLLTACVVVGDDPRGLPTCLASIGSVAGEIVVVGADDDALRIAEAHGARVFDGAETHGWAAAQNLAVSHAGGAFILCVAADDELYPDDAPALLAVVRAGAVDAIDMAIVSETHITRNRRVFRSDSGVRFAHAIDEPMWPALARTPRVMRSSFRIAHHRRDLDASALEAKRRHDVASVLTLLERDPDNASLLYRAGLGHLTLGEPRRAVSWLERALRLSAVDEHPMIENALARACFELRDHARAERHLLSSVAAQPRQHHGFTLLAEVLLLGQRHADAIVALRGALEVTESQLPTDVRPDRAALAMKLGMCELLTHDPTRAMLSLERALAGELDDGDRTTAERYLAMARRMRDRST